ncbi:hypothetical protein PspLS_11962 [Pyricularia sp. CBS 133598]|nr:hypothetical protein PspLS_11962 [Pyricularia sp. CBS 133598]
MPPKTAPTPNIIGIYGLPGAGKTTILSQLRLTGDTSPAHYDYYEGSEVIDSIVDGGLAAFKQLPHADKQRHRATAIRNIGDEARRSSKSAIVAGHFMLPVPSGESDDDLDTELQDVHTDADLATFTHIIYLKADPEAVCRQRARDQKRARKALPAGELRRWQDEEMRGLFELCIVHGIVFAVVVAAEGREVRRIADLCAFWSIGEEGNVDAALERVRKGVDEARLERAKAIVVFDADRTLAPYDSGVMFADEADADGYLGHEDDKMGGVLKRVFSGPLGYSHRAFQQVSAIFEGLVYRTAYSLELQGVYDTTCQLVADDIRMYQDMIIQLGQLTWKPEILPVVVTCGVGRVWEKVLERENLHVPVIGGGRVKDGYVVTPEVKAAVVDWLATTGCDGRREVLVYGDSPLDIPMMTRADHAFVVVGDEKTRSSTMDAELDKAVRAKAFRKSKSKKFHTRFWQVLMTSRSTPRPGLPITELEWPQECAVLQKPSRLCSLKTSIADLVETTKRRGKELCKMDELECHSYSYYSDSSICNSSYSSIGQYTVLGYEPHHNDNIPFYVACPSASKLLSSPMRDASVAGPALQEAHVQAGRYMATHLVSEVLGVEEYSIPHVQGMDTIGHRLRDEASTVIVAMMRGGEPMARGVHQVFPLARFLHAKQPTELDRRDISASVANILLVDSVVNTGESIREFVEHIRRFNSKAEIVVVAGVVQSGAIELADGGEASLRGVFVGHGNVRMVALRLSENKYTGNGGTDTGCMVLFNPSPSTTVRAGQFYSVRTKRSFRGSAAGMDFGKAVGTACATFAVTNIDDIFVLVTFFAESSTSKTLTPLRITIGQYVGFTAIIIVSMIGFGAAFLLPTEPIGFLGLLPILLGVWWLSALIFPGRDDDDDDPTLPDDSAAGASSTVGIFTLVGIKSILKVASITVINGADNISTYIPLFSQAKGTEIAVYVVTYYILLGVWCLAAFLIMKQRHILRIAQKYASIAVPFLYMGLGIFIIVESECYPWSIERIDDGLATHPGRIIMGVVTTVVLLCCIGAMLWMRWRKRAKPQPEEAEGTGQGGSEVAPVASREQQLAQDGKGEPSRPPKVDGTDEGPTRVENMPCFGKKKKKDEDKDGDEKKDATASNKYFIDYLIYFLPVFVVIFDALCLAGCVGTSPGIPTLYLVTIAQPPTQLSGLELSIGYFGICAKPPGGDLTCQLSKNPTPRVLAEKLGLDNSEATLIQLETAKSIQDKVFVPIFPAAAGGFLVGLLYLAFLWLELWWSKKKATKKATKKVDDDHGARHARHALSSAKRGGGGDNLPTEQTLRGKRAAYMMRRGALGLLWGSTALTLMVAMSTSMVVVALEAADRGMQRGGHVEGLQWAAAVMQTIFVVRMAFVNRRRGAQDIQQDAELGRAAGSAAAPGSGAGRSPQKLGGRTVARSPHDPGRSSHNPGARTAARSPHDPGRSPHNPGARSEARQPYRDED